MLGVRPLLGRSFEARESTPGRETVAMLGHALWTDRFGSDPSIVGRSITLDGSAYTVIGVLPTGFEVLGRPADLWTPLVVDPAAWFHRGAVSWLIARLGNGRTIQDARAELATLEPRMREAFEYPPDYCRNATLLPLRDRAVGSVRPALLVLLAAVGFIVLIAGANVGNLLLMRAAGRRRVIAVRTALGATRGRVVGQLLVESVVLALAGAAGVALGALGVRALRSALPPDTPRLSGVGVVLGAVGVYGVIAYAVGERRREIGVRIALGAEPGAVAGSVVMHGLRYAAVGVAIGLAGALALTRLMRSLLFGVSATDPATFVRLSALLLVIAAAASFIPARQAARTDPMQALRME